MIRESKEKFYVWICLITSSATLVCCTLPIILVFIGLGATLAAISTSLPWLMTLTEYKFWIFLVSGILLLLTEWALKRPGRSCPTDPILAEKCKKLEIWNYRILRFSEIIWIIGFISSYLALPIKLWLE